MQDRDISYNPNLKDQLELTPAQLKEIAIYREEALKRGLNTNPIDKKQAKKAVQELYLSKGLDKPEIVFYSSPMAAIRDLKGQGGNPFLWFIGAWDWYWLAFYEFAEKIGVVYDEKTKREFEAYKRYADTCGIMYPFKEKAYVCDRPSKISFDENKVLHREDGPALEFRDGEGLYRWHGTEIPKEWLYGGLDTTTALRWGNAEQRRCACEILGWEKVLADPSLNPKILDEDDPSIGTLIEVDLPEASKQWFLKYQCGTGRWHAESVNNKSFNTALKANAGGNGWRGQGDPMHYIPFLRT